MRAKLRALGLHVMHVVASGDEEDDDASLD